MGNVQGNVDTVCVYMRAETPILKAKMHFEEKKTKYRKYLAVDR